MDLQINQEAFGIPNKAYVGVACGLSKQMHLLVLSRPI